MHVQSARKHEHMQQITGRHLSPLLLVSCTPCPLGAYLKNLKKKRLFCRLPRIFHFFVHKSVRTEIDD